MGFVEALNAVHDNIWALAIIAMGLVLSIRGHVGDGGTLVTLGAAIFQRNASVAPAPAASKSNNSQESK